MSSIKKNYVLNLVYEVFALLIPLLVIPYVSRVLTSNGIGTYSFSFSISYYFFIFGALGFFTFARREIAKKRDNNEEVNQVFWETFVAKAIVCFISVVLYFVTAFFFFKSTHYFTHLLILTIYVFSQIFNVGFFYQGKENFKTIVIKDVIIKTISIICIFIFIKKESDLWKYTLIQSITMFLSFVSLWIGLPKYIFKKPIRQLKLSRCFIPALILFIPTVASSVYTILDKTLIGVLVDETTINEAGEIVKVADIENGVYDNTEKIIKMLITVLTSLSVVVSPRISYYLETKQNDKVKEALKKTSSFTLALCMPMVFGIIAVADILCPLYFGPGFDKASGLMKIMSPLIIFIAMSGVFGMQYLTAAGKDKDYIVAVCVGAVVNIALNFLLIKPLYSYGAAIATVIAEFLIMIIMMIRSKKFINIGHLVKSFIRYLLLALLMFAFVFKIGECISGRFMRLIVMVISGITIYSAELIITKDDLFKSLLHKAQGMKNDG